MVMSRRSSSSRSAAPISYTVVKPFKKNALQVQRLIGDRDASSIQATPVFNITKMHTKKVPCAEKHRSDKIVDHVYNVEPYNNENVVAQYNEYGILFGDTHDEGIWRFDHKKLSDGEYELKIVEPKTSTVIARWRKSHSKYGGWALKKQHSGERAVLARYHEDENVLDIFPYNFRSGEDMPLCQYYEQLSSETDRSKFDNPALFRSPLFLSDSILLTFLGLRLFMDIGDDQIAASSISLATCPLTHVHILAKQSIVKRIQFLASSPISASRLLLTGSRQHV